MSKSVELYSYPTPHINAALGDFAETVIMPGDPLRSKYIAQSFLTDARSCNNVRGIEGYTGYYKGSRVSVMASGMGMPSIGIYSYELYNIFGVQNIIRAGSAGALRADIPLRSLVLAMGASTDSAYIHQFNLPGSYAPLASYELLTSADAICRGKADRLYIGNVLSSDIFYNADKTASSRWASMGVLCIEMETAALYINAARAGKNALSILTISDNIVTGEATSSAERQSTFNDMIESALECAVAYEQNRKATK